MGLLLCLTAPVALYAYGYFAPSLLAQSAAHTLLSSALFTVFGILPRVCHSDNPDKQVAQEKEARGALVGVLAVLTVISFVLVGLESTIGFSTPTQEAIKAFVVNNTTTLFMIWFASHLKKVGKTAGCYVPTPLSTPIKHNTPKEGNREAGEGQQLVQQFDAVAITISDEKKGDE
jgi:hypothetical protein